MSEGKIRYEDWLRGCVHHDGRHGYVTLPCDEVLKIADFIERLRADRKTESSSEFSNNCDGCKEGQEDCYGCPFVEPKDEPQTERPTRCSECKVWRRCFKEKPSYNMIKSRCPIDEPQTEREGE